MNRYKKGNTNVGLYLINKEGITIKSFDYESACTKLLNTSIRTLKRKLLNNKPIINNQPFYLQRPPIIYREGADCLWNKQLGTPPPY